jgi:hypothetical protein
MTKKRAAAHDNLSNVRFDEKGCVIPTQEALAKVGLLAAGLDGMDDHVLAEKWRLAQSQTLVDAWEEDRKIAEARKARRKHLKLV